MFPVLYFESISVDFYKTMQMVCLKIGLSHTLNFVRISVWPSNFAYIFLVFPVRLVDFLR